MIHLNRRIDWKHIRVWFNTYMIPFYKFIDSKDILKTHILLIQNTYMINYLKAGKKLHCISRKLSESFLST